MSDPKEQALQAYLEENNMELAPTIRVVIGKSVILLDDLLAALGCPVQPAQINVTLNVTDKDAVE